MTHENKSKTERIYLSKAHIELLRSEIARTGAGPQQLMRGLSREKPEGLSSALIRNWAEGRTATAKRHHWDWVLDRYVAYAPDPSLIPLTAEMKSKLDAEIRRTQTVPAKLFRTVGEATTPSGLKAHSVRNWLIYPQQFVRESDYNWVMNAYRELPDQPYRIELDPEKLARIKAEAIRTGASGHSLLKYANGQAPDGLTPVVINRWISGKGATARSDHWAFVMEAYAKMPDASHGEQHVKLAERVAIPAEVAPTDDWSAQQTDFAEANGYTEAEAVDFGGRALEIGRGTSVVGSTDLANSFDAGFSAAPEFNAQASGNVQLAQAELQQSSPNQSGPAIATL